MTPASEVEYLEQRIAVLKSRRDRAPQRSDERRVLNVRLDDLREELEAAEAEVWALAARGRAIGNST